MSVFLRQAIQELTLFVTAFKKRPEQPALSVECEPLTLFSFFDGFTWTTTTVACVTHLHSFVGQVTNMGRDLGRLGGRPPKFEVGDGPCIRLPQYFD